MTSLGNFMKRVRESRKLSQDQVATSSGLARSYISRLEDGDIKSPSAMILVRLAKGLGVPAATIFTEAGYLSKVEEENYLPAMGAYLRAKFPHLSEEAVGQLEIYKEFIERHYADNQGARSV